MLNNCCCRKGHHGPSISVQSESATVSVSYPPPLLSFGSGEYYWHSEKEYDGNYHYQLINNNPNSAFESRTIGGAETKTVKQSSEVTIVRSWGANTKEGTGYGQFDPLAYDIDTDTVTSTITDNYGSSSAPGWSFYKSGIPRYASRDYQEIRTNTERGFTEAGSSSGPGYTETYSYSEIDTLSELFDLSYYGGRVFANIPTAPTSVNRTGGVYSQYGATGMTLPYYGYDVPKEARKWAYYQFVALDHKRGPLVVRYNLRFTDNDGNVTDKPVKKRLVFRNIGDNDSATEIYTLEPPVSRGTLRISSITLET